MVLREIEIEIETIFGTSMIQAKNLNRCKGLSESQWNPKGAPILRKNQP